MSAIKSGDYSYIGVGKVFLKEKCADKPFLHIGNVSALTFGVTEDIKEQRDYTAPGGGTTNEARRITGVECSMTLLDFDKDNISRAFFGTASNKLAQTIVAEQHKGYLGGYIPLKNPIDLSQPVTVKKGAIAIDAADYVVTSGGVEFKDNATGFANGDVLDIGYKTLAYGNVEGITESAKEYELFFEGLNEARSGAPCNVSVYRIKLGATTAMNLINEDFASFEVKGKVLRDNCKSGVGVSKYFNMQIVKGNTVDCCADD